MINVRSRRARQQMLVYIDRQMAAIERKFEKSILGILKKQYRLVAEVIEMGSTDIDHVLHLTFNETEKIFQRYYKMIYVLFSGIIFNQIDEDKNFVQYEQKTIKETFFETMRRWAKTRMGEAIVNIHTSTKNKISGIIESMVSDGKSNREIAKEILATSREIKTINRAKTIARTETHTVSMKSTNEAMNSTGLRYTKQWVSAMDSRTRSKPFSHVAADGEEVDKDGYYFNTGGKLFYPGDPAGSPGNIINCRCIEIYNTKSMDKINLVDDGIDSSNIVNAFSRISGESEIDYINRLKNESKLLIDEEWEKSIGVLGENRNNDMVIAFARYTGKGYKEINAVLRESSYLSQMDDVDILLAKEKAEKISSALEKAKLKKDLIVNRWVKSDFIKDFSENSIFQDNGFVSTSIGEDLFLEKESANIKLNIFLPKNSKAAFLSGNISSKPNEFEVLIQKNSKFKVLKIDKENIDGNEIKIYKVELLNSGNKFVFPKIKKQKIYLYDKFIWNIDDVNFIEQ
jgi:polyhydroxyalkanoate synthesis regulator phasin